MEFHSKVCSKCGEEKLRSDFHKRFRSKDGLMGHCKTCRATYQKRWRKENRERKSDYQKQWYKENRDSELEYKKNWYKENREYVLRERKQWRRDNSDKHTAYEAKRRSLKTESTPVSILECPREKVLVEQVYKLRKLLTKATGIEYHVDHIWPLSKGGPHWSGNLQIITAEENLSKSDTLCEETARVIQESLDEYLSPRQ